MTRTRDTTLARRQVTQAQALCLILVIASCIGHGGSLIQNMESWMPPQHTLQSAVLQDAAAASLPPKPQTAQATVSSDQEAGFTIAHIASPMIRASLPGQAPFPQVRARKAMALLQLAIERALSEGVTASWCFSACCFLLDCLQVPVLAEHASRRC